MFADECLRWAGSAAAGERKGNQKKPPAFTILDLLRRRRKDFCQAETPRKINCPIPVWKLTKKARSSRGTGKIRPLTISTDSCLSPASVSIRRLIESPGG